MRLITAVAALLVGTALAGCASTPPSAEDKAAAWGPIIEGAKFHHIHLNVKNRDASVAFYTRHFDARRAKFAGEDAV